MRDYLSGMVNASKWLQISEELLHLHEDASYIVGPGQD